MCAIVVARNLVLNGYIFEIMLCALINSTESYRSRGLDVLDAHKCPSMQCLLVILRWHTRWHVRPPNAELLEMNYENSNFATERVTKISHKCDTHTNHTRISPFLQTIRTKQPMFNIDTL